MRVHKLTLAALAVVASLSLTACQNDDGSMGESDPKPVSTESSSDSSEQGDATDSAGQGTASGSDSGSGSGAGSGSGDSSALGTCRTDDLEITAIDSTIDGDGENTVAVEMTNRGGQDCDISGYAGVDLETDSGTLSAERTGEDSGPITLKDGEMIAFGITYPINDSGGSGVGITGLLVTPPNETKSVTLAWPGAATLPVTDGSGTPVQVGPMGSAGQGG
ncbi:DUF4232 domain-containing protein [Streptomyces sp. NPDC059477]|uniref:DUF4232 domain-containing protein n=1 Tax=Streptomyces sp. NPDC059477 TaxID=3346847 RepID=UPI0036CDC295